MDYPTDSDLNQDNKRIRLHHLTVAQQVFGTQLLLEIILGKLNKKQLLKCRSVNKSWNAGACKLLMKITHQYMRKESPEFAQNAIQFHASTSSSKGAKTKLELLTKTITKSTELDLIFPCNQFSILYLELQCAVVQNFFSNCGRVIENLYYAFSSDLPNEGKGAEVVILLSKLLYSQLPNLHTLDLNIKTEFFKPQELDYIEQFTDTLKNQVSSSLPKLKQLSFSGSTHVPVLKFILQAAVNVEEIEVDLWDSFGETILDALVSQGKTHFLSCLSLSLYHELLGPIERLSETCSRIKKLELFLIQKHMSKEFNNFAGKVVSKLITSNVQSLESLLIFPFLLHTNTTFHIPLMPNLRKLELYYAGQCLPLFPTNYKMSQVFPQVKTLGVQMNVCDQLHGLLFEKSLLGVSYADEVLTLKTLNFVKQPEEMCTLMLPKIFPNLVFVNMGVLLNIPEAFKAFWNLTHLKILKFVIRLESGSIQDQEANENLALGLETSFTGFSMETCKKLALKCESIDLMNAESLRVNRSMLDAKCLKKLRIRFEDFSQGERPARPPCALLSHVTGQYAFAMCPQVKVYIKVFAQNKKNLEPLVGDILPVVKFGRVKGISEDKRCRYRYLKPDGCSSCRM